MRNKLVPFCTSVVMGCLSPDANAWVDPPAHELTETAANALDDVLYMRSTLDVGSKRIMLIARAYGSGLEIRDAYLYFWDGTQWSQFAYRHAHTARITMRVRTSELELVTKTGKIILSIPIDSIASTYDPKEH